MCAYGHVYGKDVPFLVVFTLKSPLWGMLRPHDIIPSPMKEGEAKF